MRVAAGALLALSLGVSAASATDINAPLDTRPTIATEMHRGWEAVDKCDAASLPPVEYVGCVIDLQKVEDARLADSRAFDLGTELAE
jgi:hypothetical protein